MKTCNSLAAVLILGLAALLMPRPVMAQKSYNVTAVQGLQNAGRKTLNNRGAVAGLLFNANGDYNAYAWYQDLLTPLPALPGDEFSGAYSQNDRGQIVGESYGYANMTDRPVLWEHGTVAFLGLLPGYLYGAADGINDAGQIVGACATDFFFSLQEATLWDHGAVLDLKPLAGDDQSFATAINIQAQVIGFSGPLGASRGVTWMNGVASELGGLGGGNTLPEGLNQKGLIVGTSLSSDGNQYPVYWQNGALGVLAVLPGATFSIAEGINNAGQMVGRSGVSASQVRAVLWEDGQVYDLNALVPAGSGWVLTKAITINERGQIFGFGVLNGLGSAFLLTPR
jgi:probable HAF family extracellular repeat protein